MGGYEQGFIYFNYWALDHEGYYRDANHKISTYSHEFGHILGLDDVKTGDDDILMWWTDRYRYTFV